MNLPLSDDRVNQELFVKLSKRKQFKQYTPEQLLYLWELLFKSYSLGPLLDKHYPKAKDDHFYLHGVGYFYINGYSKRWVRRRVIRSSVTRDKSLASAQGVAVKMLQNSMKRSKQYAEFLSNCIIEQYCINLQSLSERLNNF